MWAWLKSTSTWVWPSTTHWTGTAQLGSNRLYFLRKDRSFNVCSKVLQISLSWPSPSSPLWSPREAASQPVAPNWSRKLAVIGCSQETFEVVLERRTLNKLLSPWTTLFTTHWTDNSVVSRTASNRLLPRAITLYNSFLLWQIAFWTFYLDSGANNSHVVYKSCLFLPVYIFVVLHICLVFFVYRLIC